MCGAKSVLPLLFLFCSLSGFSQSFDEKLQAAIQPLLTLPAEQRMQVAEVLKLYRTELAGLKSEVSDWKLDSQKWQAKLETSLTEATGLRNDLATISAQLKEQSRLWNEERLAKAAQLEAVQSREVWVALGAAATAFLLAEALHLVKVIP